MAEACSILAGVLAQQLKQWLTESDRSKLKSRKKKLKMVGKAMDSKA